MRIEMKLDEKSFLIYAAKYYDMKKAASVDEFHDDVKRFQYLKRLFKRYEEDRELRIRLILNHMIVLYNCFGAETTNMLFMKLSDYHKQLKPFVMFLNFMPDYIEYDDVRIKSEDIAIDMNIVIELRKI
jgi:hypothetical protein